MASSPLTPAPERIFFVHLLKTAGTAMMLRFREEFGDRAVYPDDTDGDLVAVAPQMITSVLQQRWADRGDQIRVVIGHLPLCAGEMVDADFFTMSVLREPVARTLSFLQYHRELVPQDRELPLEAIYDNQQRFDQLIHNHMVKMLSLTAEEMTADMLTVVEFDDQRYQRARDNLENLDAVGLQSQFTEFCGALDKRFGWHTQRDSYAGAGRPDVPQSFLRRIAEDNAYDMALYDHAQALVTDRGYFRAD